MAVDPRIAQVLNRVSAAPKKGAPSRVSAGPSGIDPRLAGVFKNLPAPVAAAPAAEEKQKKSPNALMKVLQTLDKPRAAVLATLDEAGDALAGRGFSTDDWTRTVRENKSATQLMNEQGPGLKALPGWAQGAVGFVADVALDPLTYAGGAGLYKSGATGVARQLADPKIAAKLGALGFGDDAIKLGTETLIKQGIQGTDQRLLDALGKVTGKTSKQQIYMGGKIPLPMTGAVARTAERANMAMRTKFVGTGLGKSTMKLFSGKNEDIAKLKIAARQGDVAAWHSVEASRAATRAEKAAEHIITRELNTAMKKFKGADVDDMRRALEGDMASAVRLEAKGIGADDVAGVRKVLDDAAERVGLPKIEDYFPRQLSKEARKEMKASVMGGKPIGPAMKRELVAGTEFMGEVLTGNNAEIRDQINRLMQGRLGKDVKSFFSDDVSEMLSVYVKQIARRDAQLTAKREVSRRLGLGPAAGADLPAFADDLAAGAGTAGDQAAMALTGSSTDPAMRAALETLGQQGVKESAGRAAMSAKDVVSWRKGIKELDANINRLEDRLAKMAKRTGGADPNLEARIDALYKQKNVLATRIEIVKALNATDMDDAMRIFDQNIQDFDQAFAAMSNEVPKVPSDVPAAQRLFDLAATEPDAGLKQVALLEGYANDAAAKLPTEGKAAEAAVAATRRSIQNPVLLHNTVAEGVRKLVDADNLDELADVLTRTAALNAPDGQRRVLEMYDGLNQFLKRYQVLSPGFHVRNYFGGQFNNWLAGVSRQSQREWRKIWTKSKFGQAPERLAPKQRVIFDQIEKAGIFGNQVTDVAGSAFGMSLNPVAKNFALTQGSRKVGDVVEGLLRGELAYDIIVRKGGSVQDAFDDVAKFHFDYDDLSMFERNVMKRIFPFYTWTRKNLPIQLEQIAKQPAKYTAYLKAKSNIEALSEDEGVYPSYFDDLLSIRLPTTKIPGIGELGGQAYLAPDLPFRDVAEYMNPLNPTRGLDMMKSAVAVPIKLPLEMQAGKKFFNDQPFYEGWQKAPGTWKAMPGLLPALSALGIGDKGAGGEYYMDQRDAYKVEQLMPLLARIRRMFPSGEGDEFLQQRRMSSVLSTSFGIGLRANTEADQTAELKRRAKKEQAAMRRQRDLGYIK